MFIVGLLQWWYSAGWRRQLSLIEERIARAADYFSVVQLLLTLFAPFRQISAGKVRGSLAIKWRAFVDRLISRMIGAVVRTVLIVIGTLAMIGYVLVGSLLVLAWPLVPLLPVAGFLLFISGWVPTLWN